VKIISGLLPGLKHVEREVVFIYAMKAFLYRGVQVELHSFLISELDGTAW
jgi:fucose permease